MNSHSSTNPCHNCPNRNVTLTYNCHDHCPLHAAFKAVLEREREAEKEFWTLDKYGRSLIVKKPRWKK